ncbi:hypothetical protein BBP40_006709 [Aspergillus hancockii]|nr:hypothetical protein BBP40_006709 [Aspergillus hancockii]
MQQQLASQLNMIVNHSEKQRCVTIRIWSIDISPCYEDAGLSSPAGSILEVPDQREARCPLVLSLGYIKGYCPIRENLESTYPGISGYNKVKTCPATLIMD